MPRHHGTGHPGRAHLGTLLVQMPRHHGTGHPGRAHLGALLVFLVLVETGTPSSSAPPPREGSSAKCSSYATGSFRSLPIAAPDLVCDDECFCSSSYFNSIIRRSDLGLTWEGVLADTCRTEEDLIKMLRHPVTVVVGVYSRPGFFEHVTSAILSSTVNVTRLWIVCNGSPHLETFQTMTEDLKRKTTRVQVDFFSASLEVGYYERFLRVLVAQSKYLAFIDEDMQVAPRFLEICLRALSTKKIGLIGAQGYRAGKPTTWRDAKYMYFSLPIPPFLFLSFPPPPCGPPRSLSPSLCLSLSLSFQDLNSNHCTKRADEDSVYAAGGCGLTCVCLCACMRACVRACWQDRRSESQQDRGAQLALPIRVCDAASWRRPAKRTSRPRLGEFGRD